MFFRNKRWQEPCSNGRQSVPSRPDCSSWRSLLYKLKSILSLLPIFLVGALDAQTITTNPTSLTFSAQAGGSAVTQQLTVTSTTAGVQIFVYSTVPWLRVNGVDNIG